VSFFSLGEVLREWFSLPRHIAKVSRLMSNFEKRTGKQTVIVDGTRTEKRQAKIYADSLKSGAHKGAQGYRAAPKKGSKHTRGAATDLHIIGETTGNAEVDAKNKYYVILAEEAEKIGLKAGLNFKSGLPDPYHVEEPESLDDLQKEFDALTRERLWQTAIGLLVAVMLAALAYQLLKTLRA
jgi:D-alanyl-D-alanine dipeptidase